MIAINNLSMNDSLERIQALDATQSFIIQAPAGSGKTELLIQRYLTLLSTIHRPEEILAITFTKKAAHEMRSRVLSALESGLNHIPPSSEHAKNTWLLARRALEADEKYGWNLLQNPNQLRIQTIDSLCTYLTKHLPFLSHFGSMPTIIDQPDILYRLAVNEVLSHLEADFEWSAHIQTVLQHMDNDLNKLADLLVKLLSKRDQYLSYLHFDMNDRIILEKQLELLIKNAYEEIQSSVEKPILDELVALSNYANDNLMINNPSHSMVARQNNSPNWIEVSSLLLTEKGEWRKTWTKSQGFPSPSSSKNSSEKAIFSEYKNRVASLTQSLSDDETFRELLAEIPHLPPKTYTNNQWMVLQALLSVLKVTIAQLRVLFQHQGKIDFIENSQAAILSLGTDDQPTDLALTLDYKINHILIDEFQDTSFIQFHLIEKLIYGWENEDGRTLFVVGDPMQSIYRFRQAEVGLFIRLQTQGIGHLKLIPLTLSTNFRSTSTIVEWNNRCFKTVFPKSNDIATGAVKFSSSYAIKSDDNINSYISIAAFDEESESNFACHTANQIKKIIHDHPDDSIAILVRSRRHLSDLIPAIRQANIPYQALEIEPLDSKQIIQDLLSLTCALLHPYDRISWLSILRAPWCGLTLNDLHCLANTNPHASILEILTDTNTLTKLSRDGQIRVERILPIIRKKISERDRYSFRIWIENAWIHLGGPACLISESDYKDVKSYFEIIDQLSTGGFSITIDAIKDAIKNLYASAFEKNSCLKIMTIHSAKGLEFDTVILPHLESTSKSDEKSLLAWLEWPLKNEDLFLVAPIHSSQENAEPLYDFINRQQRIKLNHEADRLLYVASTRAKKRLLLNFRIDKNNELEYTAPSGSFLSKLLPTFISNIEQYLVKDEIANASLASNQQRCLRRLTSDWSNPILDHNQITLATNIDSNKFIYKEHLPKTIGTIIHRILQTLSKHGATWWANKSRESQLKYITFHLNKADISKDNLAESIIHIDRAITNTLNDPIGKWILNDHIKAASEYAITAIIDHKTQNLIIDRTFIDNDIRWIIDYKSAILTTKDVEAFIQDEYSKYYKQLSIYTKAIALQESLPIKVGLYFPAIPAWKEWNVS